MQKINLIPAKVFEIKIMQSDSSRAFLYLPREPDFSQIMVHDLNPKNLHINGFFFFVQNPKNSIFGVFLGIIPKMRFFPETPTPSVFTLKAS